MENEKLLSKELALIDELLELVCEKEEFDILVARARWICPFWIPAWQRSGPDCLAYQRVKGGAALQ